MQEDYTFKTEQVDDHTPELDQQIEAELIKEEAEKSKTTKSKMPSTFAEMIDQVEESNKKEEEDPTQDSNSSETKDNETDKKA